MSFNQFAQHSSHLLISDPITVEQQVIIALQKELCPQRGCSMCNICMQIGKKTDPRITWLVPENSYVIEQIDEIIQATQFLLAAKEKRFFIFTQAHELTAICCNRLLKTVEEPHPGYHFIFITHRPQELLQTLQSRCFIQTFQPQLNEHNYHEIIEPFIEMNLKNPNQFMKLIDKQQIKESLTKEVIDLIFEYFYKKLKESVQNNNTQDQTTYLAYLSIIKKAFLQLPIQGSYKLFWKNIFITFHHQTTCIKK